MASWSDDIDAMVRGGAPAGARTPSAAAPKSWADDIDQQVRGGAPTPETPTSIFRRAAQWAKPVGDVVSMPFRGLGMLGTEAQEAFGGAPDAESRIKVQPGASTFDSIVGNDVSAPTPADLAMEGLKVIPQALDETTDVRRPGALAGDAQDERQRFATANPGLARTEAVAEPVLNLGLQLATDPSIAALGPLGKAASGGSKAAAIAERLIGASFVPGMAEGAIDKFHEAGQAADEHGVFSPEAIRAGVGGGLEAAMAAFGAKHALAPGAHVPAAAEAPPREVPIAPEAAVAPNVWPGHVPPEMAPPPAAPGFEPPVMHFAPEQQALTPEALGIFDGYVGQDRMPSPGQFFETPIDTPERRVEERRQEQLPVPGLAAGTTFDRRLAVDPRAAPDLLEVPRVGGSEARGRAGAPQENGAPAGAELRRVPGPDVPAGSPVPDVQGAVPETETPRAAPAPRPETVAAPLVNDVSGLPPEAAREAPETQPAPRGPDRREFQEPIIEDRRRAERRAAQRSSIARDANLPEDSPVVDRLLNAEVDAKTGLWSKPAFDRDIETHTGGIGTSDVGGLKWVNDTFGHVTGDTFIEAKASSMMDAIDEINAKHPDANLKGYRPNGGGDEGAILGSTEDYVKQAYALAKENFARRVISADTPDGKAVHFTGGTLDYGTSQGSNRASYGAADLALKAERAAAADRGERAARGEKPFGLREVGSGPEGELHDPGARNVAPEPAAGLEDSNQVAAPLGERRGPESIPPADAPPQALEATGTEPTPARFQPGDDVRVRIRGRETPAILIQTGEQAETTGLQMLGRAKVRLANGSAVFVKPSDIVPSSKPLHISERAPRTTASDRVAAAGKEAYGRTSVQATPGAVEAQMDRATSTEGPVDTTAKPPAAPFNLDRMAMSPENKELLGRMYEAAPDRYEAAKGGKMTFDQFKEMGLKIGGIVSPQDFEKALKNGAPLSDPGMVVYARELAAKRADQLFEAKADLDGLRAEIGDAPPSREDATRLEEADRRYLEASLQKANLDLSLAGAQAQAARTLVAFKILAGERGPLEKLLTKIFNESC